MNPPQTNQFFPGRPQGVDPKLWQSVEQLYHRVNFLIERIGTSSPGTQIQQVTEKVKQIDVALQAVQDSLTQGSTFVAFGQSQPVADTASVALTATGVGYSISGPSSAGVIAVTNALTARTAIGAAQATAVGAHTITLAALTGGGTQGSITWNADGTVSAFVDPT